MIRRHDLWLFALAVVLAFGCARDRSVESSPPIRIALRTGPLSLDPHLRNEIVTLSVLSNVYEGLTGFEPNGRVKPVLALRWENPDELTWHFVLKSDVRFHDGEVLGADDVVFSLRRARDHPASNFKGFLVEMEAVRSVDSQTVEITTRRPYPILLNKLAFIPVVPEGSPETIREPVGTGPYLVSKQGPGERLVFRAFPGYRDGPAPGEWVEILVMPDAGRRVAGLLAGDVDLVHDLSPGLVSRVAQESCCRVLSRDSQQVEYLAMRTTHRPFDDLRVRSAIDLALDRQALVDEFLQGFGTPLSQLGNVNVFGHDPGILPGKRDLDQAKSLLEEAGYPDGLDLEIELRDTRDFSPIGAQLAEAGIRVTTKELPWARMYERLLGDEVGFYLGGIVTVSADLSDVLDSLVHTRDSELGYGQHNGVGYSDSALDRLVELSSTTFGRLARRDALHQAARQIHAEKAFLPLYGSYELFGACHHLNWEPDATGIFQFYSMSRAAVAGP